MPIGSAGRRKIDHEQRRMCPQNVLWNSESCSGVAAKASVGHSARRDRAFRGEKHSAKWLRCFSCGPYRVRLHPVDLGCITAPLSLLPPLYRGQTARSQLRRSSTHNPQAHMPRRSGHNHAPRVRVREREMSIARAYQHHAPCFSRPRRLRR